MHSIYLKVGYSPYVNKGFVTFRNIELIQNIRIQNIELYSTTIYIFMLLQYNKQGWIYWGGGGGGCTP